MAVVVIPNATPPQPVQLAYDEWLQENAVIPNASVPRPHPRTPSPSTAQLLKTINRSDEVPPTPVCNASLPKLSAPRSDPPKPAVAHPWLPRMRAFARFAFAVAQSVGGVAHLERKVIRSFLASKFGQHEVLARHIDPLVEEVQGAIPTEAETLAEVRPMTNTAEQRELYQFAEQIANATGERKPRQRETLERLALAFGIAVPTRVHDKPPAEISSPRVQTPHEPLPDPRALLGIPPNAELTPELIRRRFALLTDKMDLNKACEMGREFGRLAEEQISRLRAAAETLLAPFDVPLEKPNEALPPADLRHNPLLDDVFGG